MERIPELLLIESSAFDSPLADPHEVVEGARWITEELRKWLPEMVIALVFPPAEVLSPYLRELRTHLDLVGVRTMTRNVPDPSQRRQRLRTRQLWEVQGEGKPEGVREFDLHADRRRRFQVELGEVIDWQLVADAVIEYSAIMAIPVGTPPLIEDEPEF